MPARRALVVMVSAATMVATTATAAHAAPGHVVAVWAMNEPAGARVMIDGSGNGRHGWIGREVLTGVAADGAAGYRFERLQPNTPPPHPQHLVTVPDNADLDPGTRTYAVSLRLRTRHHFGNIIQKGQATVPGGNFKLQIPNGIVQCWFRGSAGSVLVSAPRPINDGRWHTVRCERTTDRVVLAVDGEVVAWRGGRTGSVANSWPLTIGGKPSCDQRKVSCDYFAGDIDRVEIDAG